MSLLAVLAALGIAVFCFLADKPAASSSLPYARKKYLFSAAERSFYEVLRRLTPGHTVFAKVRLADLVYVRSGTLARQSYFNRIRAKHIDFLVCDANLMPLVAIELDDSSHERDDRHARDAFVDQVLAAASVPIVRVGARRGYALDELRRLILPYLRLPPTTF